jgi:hypothetical protein
MKGHAVAEQASPEGASAEEGATSSVEDGDGLGAPSGDDPKTYDEAYVKQLRDEAAANRVKAKRTDDAEGRLRTLAITDGTRGILTDPTDLQWSDDLTDDDGWPDPTKISAAAEELVSRKPHLGRPSGDIGQGRHSEQDDAVSLTGLLKAGA